MVREREHYFSQKYGLPGNSLPIKNFLTYELLSALGELLDVDWTIKTPQYNLIWQLTRWFLAVKQRREVAAFKIIVGRNTSS